MRTLREIPMDQIEWTVENSHRLDVPVDPLADRFKRRQALIVLPYDELPMSKWNGNPYNLDGGKRRPQRRRRGVFSAALLDGEASSCSGAMRTRWVQGFRVQGARCRGPGFKVQGAGVQGAGVQGPKCKVQGSRLRVQVPASHRSSRSVVSVSALSHEELDVRARRSRWPPSAPGPERTPHPAPCTLNPVSAPCTVMPGSSSSTSTSLGASSSACLRS